MIQVSELNLLSLTWNSWPPLTKVLWCHIFATKTDLLMSIVKVRAAHRFFSKSGQSRSLLCCCWWGCGHSRFVFLMVIDQLFRCEYLWYNDEVRSCVLSQCLCSKEDMGRRDLLWQQPRSSTWPPGAVRTSWENTFSQNLSFSLFACQRGEGRRLDEQVQDYLEFEFPMCAAQGPGLFDMAALV